MFSNKFNKNYSEFIESDDNLQKKEYILKEFFLIVESEIKKDKYKNKLSNSFSKFLSEFKNIIQSSQKIVEDFITLNEKYNLYSKLPTNLEKLFQIFRLVSSKKTYHRFFHILDTFHKNGDSRLTKKEIENKLSHIFESSIQRLSNDLYKLNNIGLIRRRGIRYHLTKFGALFFSSVLKLEQDLQPDIVEQLSRTILMHSIYEEEGLNIRTYQQVQQFGFLLQELIQDWIERGEVLEWVDFLGRINHLINGLDHLAEKYDDKPYIQQILLKTKSKIAFEFSRDYETAKILLKQDLSLVDRGFYSKKLKENLNLFSLSNWQCLQEIFNNDCITLPLPELEYDLLEILKTVDDSIEYDSVISLESSIKTELIDLNESSTAIKKFIPHNKLFSRRFILGQRKKPTFLSSLITEWDMDWNETAILIGNMPSIVSKFPIKCIPIKKSKKINNGVITESILYYKSRGDDLEN